METEDLFPYTHHPFTGPYQHYATPHLTILTLQDMYKSSFSLCNILNFSLISSVKTIRKKERVSIREQRCSLNGPS
jgi:hypothetical protein